MKKEKEDIINKSVWVDYVYYFIAFAFIFYQVYYIIAIPYELTVHAVVHLGFSMILLSWVKIREGMESKLSSIVNILVLIGAIIVSIYFFANYYVILENPSYPPKIALVFGVIATFVALILCYWSYGMLFPIMALLGSLYVLFGKYLPGTFAAPSTNIERTIALLATDVTSSWGLYGSLVGLSANYLFLFMIFGSVLHAFGGLRFIMQAGNMISSKLRSGPAALAVVSSALMGSVTGSTAANVAITGTFTIPLMKKAGYAPEQAAAMESGASNGGQFLPPVMGATVFVMSAYTGIPYIEIAKACVISALMYYFLLLLYAELSARKLGIKAEPAEWDGKELLLDAPLFVGPLASIVIMLVKGYSLMTVVFFANIICVVLGLISGFLRKNARIDWIEVRDKFVDGAVTGANVAMILAVIGIVVAALEVTGLTLKLSTIFGNIAGDNLNLLLVLTMIVATILGAGVPTPAAYIIVATVLSPMLIRNGLPLLQAHLFPMFYAFLSHLTPPVGVGLLIACRMAGANYWKGAWETFKAAWPSAVLPFLFVYTPEILLEYESISSLILVVIMVSMFFFSMSIVLNQYWKNRLNLAESIILLGSFVATIGYIFVSRNIMWVFLSILLSIIPLIKNARREEVIIDSSL